MAADVSDADTQYREWMLENLHQAADHFGLIVISQPRYGWLDRSVGALAHRGEANYWLRVVSENKRWTGGAFWTGNLDSNVFTGLMKPRVLDVYEWEEVRHQRAEVMTVVAGSPCSRTDALRQVIDLPDRWWEELRRTLEVVSNTRTDRVSIPQDLVAERIQQRFGTIVDTNVTAWATVHGDLHWNNLMQPEFGLLDWEMWGTGPAGTDVATLLCYSLLVPSAVEQIRANFGDALDSEAGRVAQLYAASRLLRRMDKGDNPDLAQPLLAHANSLL
ncbi:phosphotransferase [Lentzea sp. NPDC003310]|uniref:phosphotransferase n=1 Tax=Lentzea sp. NPDC003310 TaxID=3154447 RepID=UPI0033B2D2DE